MSVTQSQAASGREIEAVRGRLVGAGQEHLLHFVHDITPAQRESLLSQLRGIEFERVPELVERYLRPAKHAVSRRAVQPPKVYGLADRWDREAARARGEALIRAGKVAAFVVAGGQGSRLGFEGPKGCYPATPVRRAPLFRVFAEGILGTQRRYGKVVPWYIMTSPLNHGATTAFFDEHRSFGLDPAQVMLFPQGVLPTFDAQTGKILLSSTHEVATNPDGHGGSVRALHASGALADMRRRGVEQVSYFQVDNPMVRVIDPVFLGLHVGAPDSSAEMSSKMVAKAGPEEKVGVFVMEGGKTTVLEYSDMDPALQQAREASGALRFRAGSIAVHAISVAFIERLAADPAALPCHRAEKKVPCIDPVSGAAIAPAHNNGVKLERFIFDALDRCTKSIVYETPRSEEFAPIKNATGADSPATSAAAQCARAASWLEGAGVVVPRNADGAPDCVLEISGVVATEARELCGDDALPKAITRGASLVIEQA